MQPGEQFVRCLLDQKDEEARKARRLRRGAVLISIVIQALVLTFLLLRPLFGSEKIQLVARLMPLPPYRGGPGPRAPVSHRPAPQPARGVTVVLRPNILPLQDRNLHGLEDAVAPDFGPAVGNPGGEGPGDPNGLIPGPSLMGGSKPIPPPPPADDTAEKGPRRVPSEVQAAMLIERVEPRYPPLALQAHLQGEVEIHALIAADGAVQSAEIVNGNVILANAAREAVLRWRYRPTLLNGRAVEVETVIRVIFKMP